MHNPFIRKDDSTKMMMLRFFIALTSIIAFALFKNGYLVYKLGNASLISSLNPLFIILAGTLTSFITETLYYKITLKKDIKYSLKKSINSYSFIPGLLLSLCLPSTTPIWVVIFGSFCGTFFGKLLYGGLGHNIFNPALIGYLFISVCYPSMISEYANVYELDTIGGSTPLSILSSNYLGSFNTLVTPFNGLLNIFMGNIPGMMGEVNKFLILIAFLYLSFTKTIKWKIPTTYVLTVFVLTLIIGLTNGLGLYYPLFNILSGGLLFGAVFMSTDPVTSPKGNISQIFYGIFLGIITVFSRYLTNYPEGVMTSILFMNMFVPLFNKLDIKYNKKYIITFIVIILSLSSLLIININNNLNSSKKSSNASIINTTIDGNKTIYEVSSKGFGTVKANVYVENNKITKIDVTDHSSETQWSEIENNNYIDKVIANQNNIDDLDTIAGSTYSSNALKYIVSEVNNEIH